jgi:putative phosphoesterase
MKIAIISDTHDNHATLLKFIKWINGNAINAIIHCGDICQRETLELLAMQVMVPIHVVYGNGDDPGDFTSLVKKYSQLILHGEIGDIVLDDQRFIVNHYPERARMLAQSEKPEFSLYGHTHKPWEELVGDCRLVNPGTLAGLFQLATFALYDTQTKKLELKLVEQL